MPEFAKLSLLFKIFLLHTNIFFYRSGKLLMPAAKKFYPECVTSSGHRVSVHHQFEISDLVGAPSLIQTNENHWGWLRWLSVAYLPNVDGRFHGVGWVFLIVFLVMYSESQNTTAMILPADVCVWNYFGGGDPLCRQSVLDRFDSGVELFTHALEMCFPSVQTNADVRPVGPTEHKLSWKNKHSWIIVATLSTRIPLLNAMPRIVILLFTKISSSTLQIFI